MVHVYKPKERSVNNDILLHFILTKIDYSSLFFLTIFAIIILLMPLITFLFLIIIKQLIFKLTLYKACRITKML